MIVVTKVEDPDELDTRFSKFAPSILKDNNSSLSSALEEVFGSLTNKSDGLRDVIRKLQGASASDFDEDEDADDDEDSIQIISQSEIPSAHTGKSTKPDHEIFYSFATLKEVMQVARVIAPHYRSESALYKDERHNTYLLCIMQGTHSDTQFQSFCHLIEEFATRTPGNEHLKYFVEEHCTPMLLNNALAQLAKI